MGEKPKYSKAYGKHNENVFWMWLTTGVFISLLLIGLWEFSSAPPFPEGSLKEVADADSAATGDSSALNFGEQGVDFEAASEGEAVPSGDSSGGKTDAAEKIDGAKLKAVAAAAAAARKAAADAKRKAEQAKHAADLPAKSEDANGTGRKGGEKQKAAESVGQNGSGGSAAEEGKGIAAADNEQASAGDAAAAAAAAAAAGGGLGSQASESQQQKKEEAREAGAVEVSKPQKTFEFTLCKVEGVDFIPCLDNEKALKALTSTKHYEHRERHCPKEDEKLRCLLPLPPGYRQHINWPQSRDEIWYNNVPHPSLASYKADQNWVKAEGDKFIFPGGGTQFKHGVNSYIKWVKEVHPELAWGSHVRVAMDIGCGVASWGAYIEQYQVKVMSVAPKDEHDAQIQFALERGVSAIVGVMGTQRQPYPANVFDAVHCARCRVPWHAEGGMLLLELNRLIRPGGYFVWSATPVCLDCAAKEPDDKEVWEGVTSLASRMCWRLVAKEINRKMGIGVAVFQKPLNNSCYDEREQQDPPMCDADDNADAAWYVRMRACLHRLPSDPSQHGSLWPAAGIKRLTTAPGWLSSLGRGVYGHRAAQEFQQHSQNWEAAVNVYFESVGIEWQNVRNVMDMDAHYGGFAAAIASRSLWTMNVVPTTSADTLPVIFDRGLLGIYHDWCESFNTYPRTYDLLHADHLLGREINAKRCRIDDIMVEMDRILRPMGYVIIRDSSAFTPTLEAVAAGLHWERSQRFESDEGGEVLLVFQKTMWRPEGGLPPAFASAELSKEASEAVESSQLKSEESEAAEEKKTEEREAETSSQSLMGEEEASSDEDGSGSDTPSEPQRPKPVALKMVPYIWTLCSQKRTDYIPCLDNEKVIKALPTFEHKQHRERHCPLWDQDPNFKCVVPLPEGYKAPIPWPQSRDEIWFANVPHLKLVSYKADQHWVEQKGEKLVFPGGGTQFVGGAGHYVQFLEKTLPALAWGNRVRVMLDMGCGVASFSAAIEDLSVRVMSMAPKDEHDAQIQFALERGIMALIGVMGSQRLPFPSNVFDAVHCARCRVPWHEWDGLLLVELNRIIRPGGFFIWSATPVYRKTEEDKSLWEAMERLTGRMCWKLEARGVNEDGIGAAVWRKPEDNSCYSDRGDGVSPPMCEADDNADGAWYVPLKTCMHPVPTKPSVHSFSWPTMGKGRLQAMPTWLSSVSKGIFGKPAAEEYEQDRTHWKNVVAFYKDHLGIDWTLVRNVMDLNALYGGFAAELAESGLPSWVLNVVPINGPDTLPAIYDRGLVGVYHDWCESFSTYPRTYDLLHVDHVLSTDSSRCDIASILWEMDRILRPNGWIIMREHDSINPYINNLAISFHWESKFSQMQEGEVLLVFQKTWWRPQ